VTEQRSAPRPPGPVRPGRFEPRGPFDPRGQFDPRGLGAGAAAGRRRGYDFSSGFGQPFPAGFHPYGAVALESFRPFTAPDGLGRLGAQLRRGPAAALRGPAGAGKQAAALGQLALLGVQRFYAVDPEARFRILDLRMVPPGSGLVLDGLPAAAAARLRRADLDRVARVLGARASWLVLTLDDTVAWADPELEELTVGLAAGPPVRAVVEAHLGARLGPGQGERARRLLDQPGLAGRLAALPAGLRRADAASLGRLLARHEGDLAAAAGQFGLLARPRRERDLVGWFAALSDQAARFFAIALAFAPGEPAETVAGVADLLDLAFRGQPGTGKDQSAAPAGAVRRDPASGERSGLGVGPDEMADRGDQVRMDLAFSKESEPVPGMDRPAACAALARADPAFGRDERPGALAGEPSGRAEQIRLARVERLREVQAAAGPLIAPARAGSGPGRGARFAEPDHADRLLRHVWDEYRPIRLALLSLIGELGTHPSPAVRRRAVASAGALAAEPGAFDQVLAAVIEPWAGADDPGRNEAATLALRATIENVQLDADISAGLPGEVRALVHKWARAQAPELRATAAWALGRGLGKAACADALALLTELAEDEHDAVVDAVCHALTAGVGAAADEGADEAVMVVFDLLENWIGAPRHRVRQTAELTVFTMAGHLVRYEDPHDADADDAGPGPGPAKPVPLQYQQSDRSRPAGSDGRTPWPGLLWLAERSPELGRRVGRLWAAALASRCQGAGARYLLDRWAEQAEPYRERREALVRLLFTAAGEAGARRILARRAGAWTKGPAPVAPRTGVLVTSLLHIS
jgi:hypothetical protein